MQTSQGQNNSNPNVNLDEKATLSPSFSPFSVKSLKVEGANGFLFGAVCFNLKHDMIIACPVDGSMKFYDATTFLPIKVRETSKPHGSIQQMSYHPETETYLLACLDGYIYSYNASTHRFKELKKRASAVLAVAFVNSEDYVFSELSSNKIFLGTFWIQNIMSFHSKNSEIQGLESLPKRNIVLAGLKNGSILIYRTSKLHRLAILCSRKAHESFIWRDRSMDVNGKYIITWSVFEDVKVWHMVRGRMRLLKVFKTGKFVSSAVYLESYKMIAIVCGSNFIKFFGFGSGKLEKTLTLSKVKAAHNIFLMKEKNMIGVTSHEDGCNVIEFVQLSGSIKH